MFDTKDTKLTRGEFGVSTLELKEVSDEGEFEGYASVFGIRDQGYDIVEKGAFLESLAQVGPTGVKMLWQHRPDDIRGKWIDMREDEHGLYVRGHLLKELSTFNDTLALLKHQLLDGMSIGYRTQKYSIDEEAKARRLQRVDLLEVSLVTFPMLKEALISRVKSDNLPTEREFEQFLARDAGFTAAQAKAIVARGYKDVLGARDAEPTSGENNELAQRLSSLTAMIQKQNKG